MQRILAVIDFLTALISTFVCGLTQFTISTLYVFDVCLALLRFDHVVSLVLL